jgi:Phosphotransferase enzyme family.
MSAIVRREMSLIQKLDLQRLEGHSRFLGNAGTTSGSHIRLLQQFLLVLPYILPPAEITRPVLLHQDLHADNIFVYKDDPTKSASVIDWQAMYAAPLFLQAKFASIVDRDDPYPWGAVQPELPEDFETLPEPQKSAAKDAFHRLRLKNWRQEKLTQHLLRPWTP